MRRHGFYWHGSGRAIVISQHLSVPAFCVSAVAPIRITREYMRLGRRIVLKLLVYPGGVGVSPGPRCLEVLDKQPMVRSTGLSHIQQACMEDWRATLLILFSHKICDVAAIIRYHCPRGVLIGDRGSVKLHH